MVETHGARSIYTSNDAGIVQQDLTCGDGYTSRNLLGQGMHISQLADVENGAIMPDSLYNVAYDMAAQDLPIPEPSSHWTVSTVVNADTGIFQETRTQSWGALLTLTTGACSYPAILGKISYESGSFVLTKGFNTSLILACPYCTAIKTATASPR